MKVVFSDMLSKYFLKKKQLLVFLFTGLAFTGLCQCPANIDFENGNFNGWQCWTGSTSATAANVNVITWDAASPGLPVNNRHTMLTSNPGNEPVDTFGFFPQSCPNGSGHSIKLGNTIPGKEAEGVSYTFTIPNGQNNFKLIYQYAVVFEGPGHAESQQPRLKIQVENLTDNVELDCSSFSFTPSDDARGFFISPNRSTGTAVFCKDWSANIINLNGNAGKTFRIFFATADCTLDAHFGYAYIDVNAECSGNFLGSVYCAGDTAVEVAGPFGYEKYEWYNKNFTTLLGNQQKIILNPAPRTIDSVKVILTPYSGYGCADTLLATFFDTLTVASASAGPDYTPCNLTPVQLGVMPTPGLVYSWAPPTGLSNAGIANPVSLPQVYTKYILTVKSKGGGCVNTDTVIVKPFIIDKTITLTGDTDHCIGVGALPVLSVNFAEKMEWFKDSVPFINAGQTSYTVAQTAKYFVRLSSNTCPVPVQTKEIKINIDTVVAGISYPVKDAVFNFPEQLQARNIGSTVLWSPSVNLDNPSSYSPVFKGLNTQLYTIKMKTSRGCITVDTQLVKTYKRIAIYMPSVFTPNTDGVNDRLHPLLIGFKKVNYFRIYNRGGKILYNVSTDLPGWDGRINGEPAVTQTVVWMLEAVDVDGKVHQRQGTTVVIK
jgi:gliding motility-associated-like protein